MVTLLLARRKQIARFRQRCKGVGVSGNTGLPQYPTRRPRNTECRENGICASRMQMHLALSRDEYIHICFKILLSCSKEELQFKYSLNFLKKKRERECVFVNFKKIEIFCDLFLL